jgi:hypothetical protein
MLISGSLYPNYGSGGWLIKVALVFLQSKFVLVKFCFGKMRPSNTPFESFRLHSSMAKRARPKAEGL